FVDDFRFLKSITKATPKITIPSPSVLHFRGGRKAIDTTAYPDMDEFYADLARVYSEEIRDLVDAGCRYLQVDEVNMAFLCDPNLRDFARSLGEDPDRLPHTYAGLINRATAARHPDMTVCMHLCRGNARSHWIADGGYEPVAEVLFNEFDVNGYFLEYDSSRAGDFRPLRFVPKGKTVVLGLVTTKKGALEKKDNIKRRIDEAAKFVPIDQLALSPQCGFASNAEGNALTVDEEKAKLQLIVEIATEVCGLAARREPSSARRLHSRLGRLVCRLALVRARAASSSLTLGWPRAEHPSPAFMNIRRGTWTMARGGLVMALLLVVASGLLYPGGTLRDESTRG